MPYTLTPKTKVCTKCVKELEFTMFHRDKKTQDGYTAACKDCRNNLRKHSKSSFIYKVYSTQKSSSKERGRVPPNYTRDELVSWFKGQGKFHVLYKAWQESGFDQKLSPSCDRINSKKPYSLDNIQLMTWEENNFKGRSEKVTGKPRKAREVKEQKKAIKIIVETSDKSKLVITVYNPNGTVFIKTPIKTKIPKKPKGELTEERLDGWKWRCVTKLDRVIRSHFTKGLYGDIDLVVLGL
jgi:hypothetical protein